MCVLILSYVKYWKLKESVYEDYAWRGFKIFQVEEEKTWISGLLRMLLEMKNMTSLFFLN